MLIHESHCCDVTIEYDPPLELGEDFDPDEEEGYCFTVYLKDFPAVSMIGETPEEALAEFGHELFVAACMDQNERYALKEMKRGHQYIRERAVRMRMDPPNGWAVSDIADGAVICHKI